MPQLNMLKYLNQKAQSVIEYTAILVVIMLAIFFMQHYIQRGIQGRWKSTGDSFGFERQFDLNKTVVNEINGSSH